MHHDPVTKRSYLQWHGYCKKIICKRCCRHKCDQFFEKWSGSRGSRSSLSSNNEFEAGCTTDAEATIQERSLGAGMERYCGKLRIGTSGYQYNHWKGIFYPEDLPKKNWLHYYFDHFKTVEINNTFYHLPQAKTFENWREEAPEGVCYTLKLSRYITHMKKLKDPKNALDQFMAGASLLRKKLGPVLVQLPPRWKANPERLDAFLSETPSGLRFTVEFRDPSWLSESIFKILEKHGAALCMHDMIEDHPDRATTSWVYYRFHGKNYSGNYSYQKLSAIADRLAEHLQGGRDVFVYFNNDLEGHAVHNAKDLQRYAETRL